jgi:hypothetical protein
VACKTKQNEDRQSGAKLLMLTPTLPPPADSRVAPSSFEVGEVLQPPANKAWWLLVALSLVSDFAMLPIVSSLNGPPGPLFACMFAVVGCTLAQGSLLAAWLVMADGPFLPRLLRHWTLAFGLWLVWFFGVALAAPAQKQLIEVGFTVACITPLVSLGAQLPLWVARHLFGWRFARSFGSSEQYAADAPLSIRDLMGATLVVAATFALARVSPAFFQEDGEYWPVLFVALAVASAASTIAILPAAAMLLRPRPFARGLALAGMYAWAYIGMIWLVVSIVRWYGGPLPPYQVLVGLSLLVLSYAGTCSLAAYVARSRGYYLAWRGRRRFS